MTERLAFRPNSARLFPIYRYIYILSTTTHHLEVKLNEAPFDDAQCVEGGAYS